MAATSFKKLALTLSASFCRPRRLRARASAGASLSRASRPSLGSYAKSSGRLWFARLSPPSPFLTYYGSLRAESVSPRDKLCVVQVVESGTKLSFRFFREGQSAAGARISRTKPLNQTNRKAGYYREWTCRGIKTVTAGGGHFCGIQRRGSFWDEQGAVGVSTHLFNLANYLVAV